MKILKCEKNGTEGWKCGEDGICHIGIEGKQRAYRDQKRIKAKKWANKEKKASEKPKKSSKKSKDN